MATQAGDNFILAKGNRGASRNIKFATSVSQEKETHYKISGATTCSSIANIYQKSQIAPISRTSGVVSTTVSFYRVHSVMR